MPTVVPRKYFPSAIDGRERLAEIRTAVIEN
jgi:hypothetical protein